MDLLFKTAPVITALAAIERVRDHSLQLIAGEGVYLTGLGWDYTSKTNSEDGTFRVYAVGLDPRKSDFDSEKMEELMATVFRQNKATSIPWSCFDLVRKMVMSPEDHVQAVVISLDEKHFKIEPLAMKIRRVVQ